MFVQGLFTDTACAAAPFCENRMHAAPLLYIIIDMSLTIAGLSERILKMNTSYTTLIEAVRSHAAQTPERPALIDSNAADPNHDTSADGVHPADWGYHLWAESVRGPILKILKKYGIK